MEGDAPTEESRRVSARTSLFASLESEAELISIRTMTVKASRYIDNQELQENDPHGDGAFDITVSWRVGKGEDPGHFAIEVTGELIGLPQGELELTVQARFHAPGWSAKELSTELIEQYGAECGIRILYPFVRQEIMDLSRRVLNGEVLLPLLLPCVDWVSAEEAD